MVAIHNSPVDFDRFKALQRRPSPPILVLVIVLDVSNCQHGTINSWLKCVRFHENNILFVSRNPNVRVTGRELPEPSGGSFSGHVDWLVSAWSIGLQSNNYLADGSAGFDLEVGISHVLKGEDF